MYLMSYLFLNYSQSEISVNIMGENSSQRCHWQTDNRPIKTLETSRRYPLT